jgi:hypothetical protein
MSHLGSSQQHQPHNPQDGAGAALLGFGALGFIVLFFVSISAVFAAALAAGLAVVLVIAVSVGLSIPLYHRSGWKSLSFVLLISAALWAALSGIVVFGNHWLAFTPTAWVLNGLYIAALASGAWKSAKSWLKALTALLAVSLVIATALLPRPPGGEGPLDTAKEWEIDVDVIDENDQPLEGALVLCSTAFSWETGLELPETFARQTDGEGRVPTWEFEEDPRMKVVICSVWKNADDGNAGYPPETQFVISPQGGGKYELHFTLTENAHPDVSYLTIHPRGNYVQAWYTLKFELWTSEPTGYVGSTEGEQPSQRKSWNEVRGNGFTIPASEAAQELRLRYFYEGPDGDGLVPPYSETRTVYLGPIPAGTRQRLEPTIPNRSSEE